MIKKERKMETIKTQWYSKLIRTETRRGITHSSVNDKPCYYSSLNMLQI